ncbi:hypothetical protein Cgig2_013960 [Carnegiea gigantea]|uniref:Uncharacterized protein n=1 Tax=Carnegiea gigantea TaxID=171969 RepID=A0A9Q1KYG7_9CARY|nr:hypothetical protein Cgig2_013960 [Carnegiea gigantea]
MQIRRALEEATEDEEDIHVCIFNVPKTLRDANPDAYTPQLVAFGPYHHWHPELQDMERYKLSSAKRILNQNPSVKFDTIVDRLIRFESRIRARYHKYLDISGETLAWMMVIDASFLLEVIGMYAINKRNMLARASSRMSHLIDYERRKSSSHNAILRDIIMLENQIPLFVLREILEYLCTSVDSIDETLHSMLIGLYKHLCPFRFVHELPNVQPSICEHLLDFFYRNIVPRLEETVEVSDHSIDEGANEEKKGCKFLMKLSQCLQQIPLRIMLGLPWVFISNLPGVTMLKALLLSKEECQNNLDNVIESRQSQSNKPPLVEEITIPSVVELSNSGVIFCPTDGDLMTISFDPEKPKFYLPTISLDHNSEVLFRNLVAYEASIGLRSLVFTRYTELMNGIIDTKDDVRVLRERGIILNYLKSDEEVADLWNGMSRSLRLTKVPFLDEVIENRFERAVSRLEQVGAG